MVEERQAEGRRFAGAVWAKPMKSRSPSSNRGMAWAWMSVGVSKPISVMDFSRGREPKGVK